jgi:DNA-binding NarL/FixJ family response regulator
MARMPPSDVDALAPLRVLVVDADDRVRESLTGLLGIGDRLTVVGSACEVGPALDLVRTSDLDVVVVDPRLPEMASGLDFINRVHAEAPGVRVVVMGWADGPEPAATAAGVDGWIRKTFRPSELVAAVVAAVAGPAEPRSGMVL